MISKCANPTCSARFLYMHEGQLYRFEREDAMNDPTVRKHSTGVEFFWLCPRCAASLKLVQWGGAGVTTYPRHLLLKAAS